MLSDDIDYLIENLESLHEGVTAALDRQTQMYLSSCDR